MVDALATLAGRGRVLELGIGTGRVALPLAARGVNVEGIDISPAMVERLRAKPGGADITVTIGSFEDVSVVGRFELVYVVYNTFYMLLTPEAQRRCVQRVAEHLRPGGSFVVEGFLLDERDHPDVHGTRRMRRVADSSGMDASHADRPSQRITLEYAGVGVGGVRNYPLELRVPSPSELDQMAAEAGLRLSARWSDWDAEPFTDRARSHISIYTTSRSQRGNGGRATRRS